PLSSHSLGYVPRILFRSFSSPLRRPPRSTPFPYTTLFRSAGCIHDVQTAARTLQRRTDQRYERLRRGGCTGPCRGRKRSKARFRSEEHTSELQSRFDLVCRLLLEKKKKKQHSTNTH